MKNLKFVMVQLALSLFATVALAQSKQVNEADLKKNMSPVTGALEAVNRLQPVTYQYNDQLVPGVKMPNGTQYGFNADNVRSVLPALVRTESKLYPAGKGSQRSADVSTVDVQGLVPVLLGAIKEQQQQIDALKAELRSLQKNSSTSASVGTK